MVDAGASVSVERRIEWTDTDAAGHYHHHAVLRFAEAAEAVLHDRLGIMRETFGRTPRIHVQASYHATLWFGDLVRTTISVLAVGNSSLRYGFVLERGDEVAASGEMVVVLIDPATRRPARWPDKYRRLLLTSGPQGPQRLVDEGAGSG